MAEKVDTKNLVLTGVGTAYLLGADGKINAVLGKMQSMKIEITSTIQDVYGGDGLFPIFNFIKEKSANFKFKNAVFDLDVVATSQGTTVATGSIALGHEEFTLSGTIHTLTNVTGLDLDTVVITADGTTLTKVADASTGTASYAITEAGAITFTSDVTGKAIVADYVYTDTNGQTVDVLTNSVPGYVQLRHESQPTELKNGKKVVLTTIIYKARCEGGLSLDYSRGEAVAPELTFKSVDPERTDKKFISYSVRYVD